MVTYHCPQEAQPTGEKWWWTIGLHVSPAGHCSVSAVTANTGAQPWNFCTHDATLWSPQFVCILPEPETHSLETVLHNSAILLWLWQKDNHKGIWGSPSSLKGGSCTSMHWGECPVCRPHPHPRPTESEALQTPQLSRFFRCTLSLGSTGFKNLANGKIWWNIFPWRRMTFTFQKINANSRLKAQ